MENHEITVFEPIDKEEVKAKIYEIRGMRVIRDKDIAAYFGVTTGNLNKAMKRNQKRFPETFCFQLTMEECSRFQIGILNGNRGSNLKYLPFVYSEQGVSMLTSVLHTDRAIEASILIMEAFVEMSHYLSQNRRLFPCDELKALELKHYQLSDKVQNIEEHMITRSNLSDLLKLFDNGIQSEEILILNGEPFKADLAYQKIYGKAKKSIIVIDDYLGTKTLHHLVHAMKGVDITIISDNKGNQPLRKTEYQDFLIEYPEKQITFIKTQKKAHDRYIVLDNGLKSMKVYHCGASSKDAGNKITTITQSDNRSLYHPMIEELLKHPGLELK